MKERDDVPELPAIPPEGVGAPPELPSLLFADPPADPPTSSSDAPTAEDDPEPLPPPVAPAPDPVPYGDEPSLETMEALSQRARRAEARLTEVVGAYRKLREESDEHKARVTRNLERRYDQKHERLVLKFIDTLDNLDRALEAAESSFPGEAVIQGIILVRTQLLQTLKDEGLERIRVLGLTYEPSLSESVGLEQVDDPEKDNVVLRELQRGYQFRGKVARPSLVIIGVYTPPAGAPEDPRVDLAAEMDASPAEVSPEAPPDTPAGDGEE